jgi:hypothetical protein
MRSISEFGESGAVAEVLETARCWAGDARMQDLAAASLGALARAAPENRWRVVDGGGLETLVGACGYPRSALPPPSTYSQSHQLGPLRVAPWPACAEARVAQRR